MGAACTKRRAGGALSEEELVDVRAATVAEVTDAFAAERAQLEDAKAKLQKQLQQRTARVEQLELELRQKNAKIAELEVPAIASVTSSVVAAELVPVSSEDPAVATVVAEAVTNIYTDNTFAELGRRIEHEKGAQAAVRLLKASYLVGLYKQGKRLVRRQEMPEEAFYTGALDDPGFRLFAISYPWITAEHPDPDGFHLRTIGALLQAYGRTHVAVFLDYCSLDQAPRSDEESARFRRRLGAVELIYAHQVSIVLCLTVMPPGADRGYDARGWCFFERLVAGALTESQNLLDVGKLQVAPDKVTDFYAQVDLVCDVGRRPPLTADAFELELGKRQFTNGKSDHALVARLYATFVEEALGSAEKLDFASLRWGDDQAEELAAVLPLCKRLRELILMNNNVGDRGAAALARSLPAGLEVLDLSCNAKLGDEGVAALAAQLPASLRVLNVQAHDRVPQLRCPVVNARTRQAIETIQRFYAGDEATKSAIIAEVATARKAAKAAAAGGPSEVVIDGVRCVRRIYCGGGSYGFGKNDLGGVWQLSQDEPLIDGAPHYEHELPTGAGQLAHLYRHQSAFGNVRRWVVGPTPGAEGGWGVTVVKGRMTAPNPMDKQLEWQIYDHEGFVADPKFRFTEHPGTDEEEGSEEEGSEDEDEGSD